MGKDRRKFYDLETYIFNDVREHFLDKHYIDEVDFFCIIIWKANRMKSKIAKGLLRENKGKTLEEIVRTLTNDIYNAQTLEAKLKVLIKDSNYKFHLPTASAILSAFYPDDFSVYDFRVCETFPEFEKLDNISKFDVLWKKYAKYIEAVRNYNPNSSLRDNDRLLWGVSFYKHLDEDIKNNFNK